jgi:hypothetical protein
MQVQRRGKFEIRNPPQSLGLLMEDTLRWKQYQISKILINKTKEKEISELEISPSTPYLGHKPLRGKLRMKEGVGD